MIFFRCGISWDFTSQECFRSIHSVDHGHGGYRCRRGLLVGVQGTLRDHEVTTKTDSASKVSYLTSDVCIWVEIVKRCQELQDLKKKKHAKHPKSTTIRRYEIFPMTFWDFTRFDCLGEASHRFCRWDSLPNRFKKKDLRRSFDLRWIWFCCSSACTRQMGKTMGMFFFRSALPMRQTW